MTERVKAIPEGASVVIPRLFCRDPVKQIEFCRTVFDAVERNRRQGSDGSVAHALMTIGSAMVMIESEWPGFANRAPAPDGSSPVALYVYVENVDDITRRAVAAGARILVPPTNQLWGDRTAWIVDPSDHVWTIATRIEEPTEQERKKRFERIHESTSSEP